MKYDIWMEGFSDQEMEGMSEHARLLATVEAETFEEACQKYIDTVHKDIRNLYNKERNTIWGCRLYDNEADACKFFG